MKWQGQIYSLSYQKGCEGKPKLIKIKIKSIKLASLTCKMSQWSSHNEFKNYNKKHSEPQVFFRKIIILIWST